MRIFFIGTVDFSRAMFNSLLEVDKAEIVGIATKPSSQFNSDHSDISDIAIKEEIPYKYVRDINHSDIVDWIRSLKPDVIYCMGWSSLIKKELLELSPLGVVGFHPTNLPKNRGRHPLIWALVLGLNETATTFFLMDEGADSGDILSQVKFSIEEFDSASDLYRKMIKIASKQLKDFTPKLAVGRFNLQKQDHTLANYWRKRSKADGRIDFRMSTQSIFNLVRALTKPYIGAHFDYKGGEYKVWHVCAGPKPKPNLEPGQVIDSNKNNQILVKTGDGSIWIKEHELDKIPNVSDYLI